MLVLDLNETHGLALLAENDLSNVWIEPIRPEHFISRESIYTCGTYLNQAHCVARTVGHGLTAQQIPYPRDGWAMWRPAK